MQSSVSSWTLFLTFLRLGLTSFGGPIAHLGYFRTEFVEQKKWLTDQSYSDLVALCQFLPGPASSQVGLGVGLLKAGYRGAAAAWVGFTLPSAIVITLFALGVRSSEFESYAGAINGLKVLAVAVVAHAVWGMAVSLCQTAVTRVIAVTSAVVLIFSTGSLVQLGLILASAVLGVLVLQRAPASSNQKANGVSGIRIGRQAGLFWLALFFILLVGLPMLSGVLASLSVNVFADFYRAGALVFGGGHVVLPLLEAEVVQTGLVNRDDFMAGYGASQAVPGPLFTFAAYLGGVWNGIVGAVLCLIAIFLPGFLLVAGALPFWQSLRENQSARGALTGVNACVVGILAAALYQPLFTTAIVGWPELSLALLSFLLLQFAKAPSWVVVLFCGVSGFFVL